MTALNKWESYLDDNPIGVMRKYSYHWQDKKERLLIRWDNAPDWEVETFPHHSAASCN